MGSRDYYLVSIYHCLYLSQSCYPTLRYAVHRLLSLARRLIVFTLDVISQHDQEVPHND